MDGFTVGLAQRELPGAGQGEEWERLLKSPSRF